MRITALVGVAMALEIACSPARAVPVPRPSTVYIAMASLKLATRLTVVAVIWPRFLKARLMPMLVRPRPMLAMV